MESCDTVIVGAGAIGCALALRLSKAGLKVCVLERERPGAEASGAAAGILAPQAEAHAPGPFLELCLRSASMYPALAEELRKDTGLDVGYVKCGLIEVATDEAAHRALEVKAAAQRALGLRGELLTVAQARSLEPRLEGPMLAALHLPDDHQVDPPLLIRALFVAAAKAGALFRSGVVEECLRENGAVVGVRAGTVSLRSSTVVVAAGAWSGLVGGLHAKVAPARGQMAELTLARPAFRTVVMGASGYVVPRADGRVICGSTEERVGFDRAPTPEGIGSVLRTASTLVPVLSRATVTAVWNGFRPATPDSLPLLGATDVRGLLVASGHYRNGILLAPVTAQVVSDLILGRPPELDLAPFSPTRFN